MQLQHKDALWVGVQTVSMTGESPVNRVGGALQRHAGLTQFIATSVVDNVAKVPVGLSTSMNLVLYGWGCERVLAVPPWGPDVIAEPVERAFRETCSSASTCVL